MGSEGESRHVTARVYHSLIALAFLTVVILALVSLGTLADKHNDFLSACSDSNLSISDCGCILYSDFNADADPNANPPTFPIQFSTGTSGGTCPFAIWGEAIVAAMAIALGVVAVVKVFLGTRVKTWFVLVELIVLTIALLLDFIIAIVITAGLNETCAALDDDSEPNLPCRDYRVTNVYGLTGRDIGFFDKINSSQAAAWVAFGVMAVVVIVYIVVLVFYCRKRRRRSGRDSVDGGGDNEKDSKEGKESWSTDHEPEEKPSKPI